MLSQLEEEEEDDYLNQPIDKNKVPPIHQKRLLAFVNHFIVETVSFLNRLITDCDLKFVAFESKLRKVEDSLAILESKLSSIPGLPPSLGDTISESINPLSKGNTPPPTVITPTIVLEQPPTINSAPKTAEVVVPQSQANEDEPSTTGVKASEDYRYKKYFKMIHFGVPQQAVKNKLISEGLDPSILDDANQILGDGQRQPPTNPDDDDNSSGTEEDSS